MPTIWPATFFSRVVYGSRIVLIIAPAATLIAYMVGSTLGLPAGYYTGWIDTVMSFIAISSSPSR